MMNKNNYSEFFKCFSESDTYKKLFDLDCKILAIFISGSRAIDVVDNESDYDIVVLAELSSQSVIYPRLTFNYEDKPVHIFIYSYELFEKSWIRPYLAYLGLLEFNNIDLNKFCYISEDYRERCSKLIENRNTLAKLAAYRMYLENIELISNIINSNQIDIEYRTKRLYTIDYILNVINNSRPDTEYLNRLKRITKNNISVEDEKMFIRHLQEINNYMITNKDSLEQLLKDYE